MNQLQTSAETYQELCDAICQDIKRNGSSSFDVGSILGLVWHQNINQNDNFYRFLTYKNNNFNFGLQPNESNKWRVLRDSFKKNGLSEFQIKTLLSQMKYFDNTTVQNIDSVITDKEYDIIKDNNGKDVLNNTCNIFGAKRDDRINIFKDIRFDQLKQALDNDQNTDNDEKAAILTLKHNFDQKIANKLAQRGIYPDENQSPFNCLIHYQRYRQQGNVNAKKMANFSNISFLANLRRLLSSIGSGIKYTLPLTIPSAIGLGIGLLGGNPILIISVLVATSIIITGGLIYQHYSNKNKTKELQENIPKLIGKVAKTKEIAMSELYNNNIDNLKTLNPRLNEKKIDIENIENKYKINLKRINKEVTNSNDPQTLQLSIAMIITFLLFTLNADSIELPFLSDDDKPTEIKIIETTTTKLKDSSKESITSKTETCKKCDEDKTPKKPKKKPKKMQKTKPRERNYKIPIVPLSKCYEKIYNVNQKNDLIPQQSKRSENIKHSYQPHTIIISNKTKKLQNINCILRANYVTEESENNERIENPSPIFNLNQRKEIQEKSFFEPNNERKEKEISPNTVESKRQDSAIKEEIKTEEEVPVPKTKKEEKEKAKNTPTKIYIIENEYYEDGYPNNKKLPKHASTQYIPSQYENDFNILTDSDEKEEIDISRNLELAFVENRRRY